MRYPWYETVSETDLAQGDVFSCYPIFVPKIDTETVKSAVAGEHPLINIDIVRADVIVLSQSCDLANNKIDTVILCPVFRLEDTELSRDRREQIRQGKEPAIHMLNQCDVPAMPLSIVEFKRIHSTPKAVLIDHAATVGSRIRLLPPYREHLAQSFARYFMRVGLPNDIKAFK